MASLRTLKTLFNPHCPYVLQHRKSPSKSLFWASKQVLTGYSSLQTVCGHAFQSKKGTNDQYPCLNSYIIYARLNLTISASDFVLSCISSHGRVSNRPSALLFCRQPSYLQTLSHILLPVRNVGQLTTSRKCESILKKPSCWPVFHRVQVQPLASTL